MGQYITVAMHLDADDEVRVSHNAKRLTDCGTELPETVHVHIGRVDVFGPPARVAQALDMALTEVQAFVDALEGAEEGQ
jgi:hypothetical protein